MADFEILDPQTGKKYVVTGQLPPTPQQQQQILHQLRPMIGHVPGGKIDMPDIRPQTPLGVMGAMRGAVSAGFGSLLDDPTDRGKALGAMGHELMNIGVGAKPTEPSEALKMRGVDVGPAAGVLVDSMIDPLNIPTAGEDAIQGGVKGLLEHTPELIESTHHLYAALIADVLPILNKPETPQAILKMVERAGAGIAAKVTGFAEWLTAQGGKALSRAQVVGRLLREPEFRQILMEHAHPLMRPAVIAGDYANRAAEEGEITEPSAMTKLILAMAPFLATATGTVQKPNFAGNSGELIDDVTELPYKAYGERKKSGDPIRYGGED